MKYISVCFTASRGASVKHRLDVQPSAVAKEQPALGHALVVGVSQLSARRDESGRHTAVDRCVCSLLQTTTTVLSSWLHSSAPLNGKRSNSEQRRHHRLWLPAASTLACCIAVGRVRRLHHHPRALDKHWLPVRHLCTTVGKSGSILPWEIAEVRPLSPVHRYDRGP